MIMLNAASVAKFAYLASVPTHAAVSSRTILTKPGSFGINGLNINYWFGTLDAGGAFIVNVNTGTHVFQIPDPRLVVAIDPAILSLVLGILFGAGIAPSPTDPTVVVLVPGKKAGDHKIVDIDAVAAFLDANLAGTVV